MCFNPGDGQLMMLTYVFEKVANALNDRFIAAGLDRVVPTETNAAHTVREKIDSLRGPERMFLGVPRKPLQSVVDRADFPGVVGGTRSSHAVELSRVSYNGSPQRRIRVVGVELNHNLHSFQLLRLVDGQ